jgi:hypothetical protein
MTETKITIEKVVINERGWHDIFETMLAQAMNVSRNKIKDYVKTTENNQPVG